ncbi:hypothetical protein CIB48_g9761 [Xylaria polymorpha]|nr:hypothetical protein CIB48_g9761 [Xylaria polymorpha]
MEPQPPQPDWAVEPEWHWDAWKFGMDMDELFTTLHSRFNTWSAPLQSFEAFHHDVWEISNVASTREDLFRALEMRKEKRSQEMARVWDFMALYMTAGRSILPEDHWAHGIRFFRTRSLDNMLAFLYQFLNEEEKEEVKVLNKELGRLHDDQAKNEHEEEQPSASVSVDNAVDVNNTPTSSTKPRPLRRDRDQPSPIDTDSDYHPHHYCKREYDTNHNIIITSPPADDEDDDVLALPTPTPSPSTASGRETHTATAIRPSIPISSCSSSSNEDLRFHNHSSIQTQLDQHISSQSHPCPLLSHSSTLSPSSSPSSLPPSSFSASPLVNTTTEIMNTSSGSGSQQRELRQELRLRKQRQRLHLSHNKNSNNNGIAKRGRRIIPRGKSKALKLRPKLITVAPSGKKGSSLTTTATDDPTTTATTSTSTR